MCLFLCSTERYFTKRFYASSLDSLYAKYARLHPGSGIKRSSFIAQRPRYVQKLKLSQRETCMCRNCTHVKWMLEAGEY